MRKTVLTLTAAALVLAVAITAHADQGPAAQDYVRFSADSGNLYWDQLRPANGFEVVVTDPHGRHSASWTFQSRPTLSLSDLAQAFPQLADGCYAWEVTSRMALDSKTLNQLKALRDAGQPMPVWWHEGIKDARQSGTFWIVKGNIEFDAQQEKTPDSLTAQPANLGLDRAGILDGVTLGTPIGLDEQVISNNLTVRNSLCVGFDCLNVESFGTDSIRLKENNLRIHFDDTSFLSSFPNRDWRIEANSPFNGGGEHFRVVDATGNRNIFTLEGNAPSSSLVVDDAGRVGVGTALPLKELHVVDGNEATLRLAQDGSAGFAPQSWDVAGNEIELYIRDSTHFSAKPFRIRSGAPTDAFTIHSNGEIGIGVSSSDVDARFDLNGVDDGTDALSMDFGNTSTGVTWFFQNDQDESFKISREGSGGAEIVVRRRGDASGATLSVDGSIEATNVAFSSSRTRKTAFRTVDPVDVLERLAGVPILEWRYKGEAEGVKHLGPVAEEFMDAFGLGRDERRISVTDINGVALAAIQGLHRENRELRRTSEERLDELHEENRELRRMNEELLRRLETLEARLPGK